MQETSNYHPHNSTTVQQYITYMEMRSRTSVKVSGRGQVEAEAEADTVEKTAVAFVYWIHDSASFSASTERLLEKSGAACRGIPGE